jgi:ATP-binding cassette, subfamily C, bacterial LapB
MIYNNQYEALLDCLVTFTKLYHIPYSKEALINGLPISETKISSIDPLSSNFHRAAKKAGLVSKLIKRDINDLSSMVLPCILTLKNNDACILEEINHNDKKAKIILSNMPEAEEWITIEELEANYLGFAFLLKKQRENSNLEKKLLDHNDNNWFWGTLYHSKNIYRDVILASILINIFVLATPLFTMNIYDRVVPNSAIETLWVLSIGIFIVFIFDMILKLLRTYFLETASKKSEVIMSSLLFRKVMNLKMANRPKSIGAFASNIKEFDTLRNFFNAATIATMVDLPFIVIFLSVTYLIGGVIVLAPIFVILTLFFYSLLVKKPLRESVESTYESAAFKNAILIESLNNLEAIKAINANRISQYNWEEATADISKKSIKSKTLSNSIVTVTNFLIQFNTVCTLIIGVYLISNMNLTMGALIASVILSSRAIAPIGNLAALLVNYQEARMSLENLDNLMKLPEERPIREQFIHMPEIKGKIEFQNVNFTYPEEKNPILKGVSFKINPGEKVAIIGKNGSGKSTIANLILNLYNIDSGSILIDDLDISQIEIADLRKQISYVPQYGTLFRGTLRSNIVYKHPKASDEQILKASYISGVNQFANINPLGFNMPIGEQGYGLSGGQKQSICIARAFVETGPIVLLDEPTGSLDNQAENRFIAQIKEELKDKTVIIITHKSSTMSLVDRLILIDNGKIIMDGPKQKVLDALQRETNDK